MYSKRDLDSILSRARVKCNKIVWYLHKFIVGFLSRGSSGAISGDYMNYDNKLMLI